MIDPVVSPDWLAARLSDPNIRIVDATLPMVGQTGHGRDSYVAGHIPGAVFFDINAIADPTTDLPHMLPTLEAFATAAGDLGLSPDATTVVYDAHGIYSAPRVWWTLRTMGYSQVFVLDGGLPAWTAAGLPIETAIPSPRAVPVQTAFKPGLLASLADVAARIEDRAAQIVDARPAARFTAETPEPRANLRSGHMPGALNVPFGEVVTAQGTLRPADALREVFQAVDPGLPVITSCGSGITAAILALALARLGRQDVAVYDGSWTEWAARADTAIVTGA